MREYQVRIRKGKLPEGFRDSELKWEDPERQKVESRILRLRDDQIAALLQIAGPGFSTKDIENVVAEIKNLKHDSLHLDVLMTEASSRELLLWWLAYFESHRA